MAKFYLVGYQGAHWRVGPCLLAEHTTCRISAQGAARQRAGSPDRAVGPARSGRAVHSAEPVRRGRDRTCLGRCGQRAGRARDPADDRPTARLDDIAGEFSGPVGLIKIDVEGHEQAVLDGAQILLQRDHPVLVIETESRHGADVPALFAGLHALGYNSHLWRAGRLEPVTSAAFLQMQHMADPAQPGYVNNVIFVAGAA